MTARCHIALLCWCCTGSTGHKAPCFTFQSYHQITCVRAIDPINTASVKIRGLSSSALAGTWNWNSLCRKVAIICENCFHHHCSATLAMIFRGLMNFTISRGQVQHTVEAQGCRRSKASQGSAPPACTSLTVYYWLNSPGACLIPWQESVLKLWSTARDLQLFVNGWGQDWGMLKHLGTHSRTARSVRGIFSVVSESCFIIRN